MSRFQLTPAATVILALPFNSNKMAPYRQLLTGEEQLQSTLLSDLQVQLVVGKGAVIECFN